MKDFYNKYKNIIKMIIAFLIFYFLGNVIVTILKVFKVDIAANKYTITVAVNIIRAIVLFLMFRKDLKEDFKKFKKNFWEYNDVAVKSWVIGLVVMCVSNVIIGIFAPSNMPSNEEGVRTMIKAISFVAIILTGITAPISEEILFRKSIKNVINKNKWLYVIVSGLVFGAAHIVTKESALTLYDYLYIIPYSSLGFAFAYTCQKTDNIFPSMLIHSLHNIAITLAAILMGSSGMLL